MQVREFRIKEGSYLPQLISQQNLLTFTFIGNFVLFFQIYSRFYAEITT